MKNIIKQKEIKQIFKCYQQGEGDGATVRRIIGNSNIKNLDPFLMLDFFIVRLPAGFPDHPHRGFETVTYMIEGEVHHEDFKGHKGIIKKEGIQWMTAGKGIVHSEMPGSFTEDSIGFQLWINLDKKNKMCEPQYQEFNQLPIYEDQSIKAIIISGQEGNQQSSIKLRTNTYFIDYTIKEGQNHSKTVQKGLSCIVFIFKNSMMVNDTLVSEGQCIQFIINDQQDEQILFHNPDLKKQARFIFLAGQPINEPIAQYGPFVMNTNQELQETFHDYQKAKNGFEGAQEWESKIKDMKFQNNK